MYPRFRIPSLHSVQCSPAGSNTPNSVLGWSREHLSCAVHLHACAVMCMILLLLAKRIASQKWSDTKALGSTLSVSVLGAFSLVFFLYFRWMRSGLFIPTHICYRFHYYFRVAIHHVLFGTFSAILLADHGCLLTIVHCNLCSVWSHEPPSPVLQRTSRHLCAATEIWLGRNTESTIFFIILMRR